MEQKDLFHFDCVARTDAVEEVAVAPAVGIVVVAAAAAAVDERELGAEEASLAGNLGDSAASEEGSLDAVAVVEGVVAAGADTLDAAVVAVEGVVLAEEDESVVAVAVVEQEAERVLLEELLLH